MRNKKIFYFKEKLKYLNLRIFKIHRRNGAFCIIIYRIIIQKFQAFKISSVIEIIAPVQYFPAEEKKIISNTLFKTMFKQIR